MFSKYWYFTLISSIVFIVFLRQYIKTDNGRRQFDRMMLKLPVFGELFRKVAVAKFCRTLSTLVKSGVSILVALDIVSKTSDNKVIEDAVATARDSIREGESIAKPLSESKVFPTMVTRMISVGEQSGELEKMLTKIANFYDEQVDAIVSGLTSMIEPLIIAFLGIIIGGIVIALFMPIFKITQLIAK
jgi:type IV pilus assembly protein PilC